MSQKRLRYEDFWDRINVDDFEAAIGWSPEYDDGKGNDVGYCPFPENHAHGDTTGKFAIERDLRVYNCWVCGGGSLLSLAMEVMDLDVDEATRWLYQFCESDTRSDSEFVDDFLDAFRDVERRVATLPYFNDRVLNRFLLAPPDEYLIKRGITNLHIIEQYGVRYSPEVRRPAPARGKFAEAEDYTGPGVIFPHYWKGQLVGWQTRWLDHGRDGFPEWIPKYTNTSDFPKETTIYGWDHVRTSEAVVVCESVPTVLFLASRGYAAVATFGSSVNDAQLRLLRRYPTVLLAADNDPAGRKWLGSLTRYLRRYSTVQWVPPVGKWDEGGDLGDLVEPPEALDKHLCQMHEPGIDL